MRAKKAFNQKVYARLLAVALPVVIGSEEEYKRLLAEVEKLMMINEEKLTAEQGMLLDLLGELIETYEDENYPMPDIESYKIVQHLMAERDLKQADLAKVIGSDGLTSEIYNGKRSISGKMARKLGEFFQVDYTLFL